MYKVKYIIENKIAILLLSRMCHHQHKYSHQIENSLLFAKVLKEKNKIYPNHNFTQNVNKGKKSEKRVKFEYGPICNFAKDDNTH